MHHSLEPLGELELTLQDQDRLLREACGGLAQRIGDGPIVVPLGTLEFLRESCRVRTVPNGQPRAAHWVRC